MTTVGDAAQNLAEAEAALLKTLELLRLDLKGRYLVDVQISVDHSGSEKSYRIWVTFSGIHSRGSST